jgi:hypothetical protein
MSTKDKNELSPKHLQALDLIRGGGHTYRDIANIVGFSEDHLYDLTAGDTQKAGSSAFLFAAEIKKYNAERDKKFKMARDETKTLIMEQFQRLALAWKGRKPPKLIREEMRKIMEVLAKSTPNVEIGSFSYTKGLSVEDLVNEFRRLKGLAADGRGVLPTFQRGTGELPRIEEPRGSTP